MKRKFLLFLAAITFVIIPLSIFADHVGGGIIRSQALPFANVTIEAGQSIDVAMLVDNVVVQIEIKDNSGSVFVQKSVNTAVSKLEHIDISDLPSGAYTIKCNNQTSGQVLVNSFTIN